MSPVFLVAKSAAGSAEQVGAANAACNCSTSAGTAIDLEGGCEGSLPGKARAAVADRRG